MKIERSKEWWMGKARAEGSVMPDKFMATPNAEDYDELEAAVLAYLSECDNPVPDYRYRRTLRNRLREITGAPAEPAPRQRS